MMFLGTFVIRFMLGVVIVFPRVIIKLLSFLFNLGAHGIRRVNDYSLQQIDNMTGKEFEVYSAKLLKKCGAANVTVTRASGDYGADILCNFSGKRYAIQCKRFKSKVGITAVQEVFSAKAKYGCDAAAVITNNYFTPNAIELAQSTEVILWDRNALIKFINIAGKNDKKQQNDEKRQREQKQKEQKQMEELEMRRAKEMERLGGLGRREYKKYLGEIMPINTHLFTDVIVNDNPLLGEPDITATRTGGPISIFVFEKDASPKEMNYERIRLQIGMRPARIVVLRRGTLDIAEIDGFDDEFGEVGIFSGVEYWDDNKVIALIETAGKLPG